MSALNPKRQSDESYEDYCTRRTQGNKYLDQYLKGRLVWKSSGPVEVKDENTGKVVNVIITPIQGTYRKPKEQ